MRRGAALVTLLVLTSSFALAKKASASKPFSQLARVPASDRARANPFKDDPDAVPAGRKLYDRHCAHCHGVAGANGRKGPGLRVPEFQSASDGAMFWVITNGNVRSGMPVWSKLPEAQRWQMTAYLRSLGK